MSDPQSPFPAPTDAISTVYVRIYLDADAYSLHVPETQLKPLSEALNHGRRISFRIGHQLASFDFGNCRYSRIEVDTEDA